MLMRAQLFDRERFSHFLAFGKCDVSEQCRIIFWGGSIFVRDEIETHIFERVEYLYFDGIDPDTICVVRHLDHEREAA